MRIQRSMRIIAQILAFWVRIWNHKRFSIHIASVSEAIHRVGQPRIVDCHVRCTLAMTDNDS